MKGYVKVFGIELTAWQWEIIGVIPFLMFAYMGICTYLTSPSTSLILIPSAALILILIPSAALILFSISDVISVYIKEKLGYFDDEY